jgi:pyruvate formate-lyase/glycerol dehydratase family glycyl radical enzyme
MSGYVTLPVPERIHQLKEELFSTSNSLCFQRARIVTESYRENEGEHSALRRARALYDVFAKMPIFIREGELLVGQRASVLGGRSVYPEFNLHGLKRETTPPEIWDYWQDRSMDAMVKAAHPGRLTLAEREMASGYCTGTSSGFGHVIVDYEKALNQGFRSIIAEATELLKDPPGRDVEGWAFLEAVIIASEGIILWAERYADLADAEASAETDPTRRAELKRIAETCRRVPAEPARDFTEAMQSFWFVHLAMHIEQYGWSISAGRFDQYIYPFYRDDVESGKMSREQTWELLLNLWVKFMENVGTQIKATTFQNLTLGGQDRDGRDQSNELSSLCLDATVVLGFNQPALSIRWHPDISPEFWDQVHRAVAVGHGMPALFNDDVIIPALIAHGVDPEDARGYGIVGCVEASVPGKEQGVTAGGHINVAKALELALNDGRSMITGEQIGIPTGDPGEFRSFGDLWKAYVTQVEYLAGLNILATHAAGEQQKRSGHCPLMSSLLDDCLANRRDLVFGGTRYNLPGIAIYGPSNVYDGLMAIRRCVCEEKCLTWAELHQALLDDFEGHEAVRQMLAHSGSRFGNGIEEVDDLANRVNAVHADFCWKQVDSRNGRYTCGVWPVNGHVSAGHWTAATPDGRRKGEPLVDGVGACQGADRNGPTALLQSVARLNNIEHWPAGNTCNIKFSRTSISSEDGVSRMRELTTTFMKLGGQELQINVVDAATLRAAKADPERYQDLIVRVAGYSAYFTQLGSDVQDEIIARTEHTV